MARLPQPGGDKANWGNILNDYLLQSHKSDGSLKDNVVNNAVIADTSIQESKLSTAVQGKLNGSAAVTSVAGRTGAVTLTKADVGLGNVDNTSDLSKPISTLTQTALNAKRPMLTPEQYGAVGNGTTDDTTALQTMFNAAGGKIVYLDPTKSYKHTAVLTISVNSVQIIGGGTLLATAEQTSEVLVSGKYITMENITLKMSSTTQRWTEFEKMKLRITGDNFIARNLTINGSAAAGIMVYSAGKFLLEGVEVFGTRADGIHCTGGAHDGSIIGCYSHDTGDDSFAVVSYEADGVQCTNIINIGCYSKNSGARGFSVVGGTNIRLYNGRVDSSTAAAIYVACEPSYTTYGVSDVIVEGFELVSSNTAASTVDQGAILIYNGRSASYLVQRLTIRAVTIRNTNTSASRQIGLLCDVNGADNIRDVILAAISLAGSGPAYKLDLYHVPSSRCQVDAILLNRRVYTTSSLTASTGIDQVVLIGPGGSVTLPTAVNNVNRYTVKNVDSSGKTISTSLSQTINGSASVGIAAGAQFDIIADSGNWFTL